MKKNKEFRYNRTHPGYILWDIGMSYSLYNTACDIGLKFLQELGFNIAKKRDIFQDLFNLFIDHRIADIRKMDIIRVFSQEFLVSPDIIQLHQGHCIRFQDAIKTELLKITGINSGANALETFFILEKWSIFLFRLMIFIKK